MGGRAGARNVRPDASGDGFAGDYFLVSTPTALQLSFTFWTSGELAPYRSVAALMVASRASANVVRGVM